MAKPFPPVQQRLQQMRPSLSNRRRCKERKTIATQLIVEGHLFRVQQTRQERFPYLLSATLPSHPDETRPNSPRLCVG